MKKGKPVTFRPDPETRKWLEIGQEAGFDMTTVINLCLQDVGSTVRQLIKDRDKHLKEILSKNGL